MTLYINIHDIYKLQNTMIFGNKRALLHNTVNMQNCVLKSRLIPTAPTMRYEGLIFYTTLARGQVFQSHSLTGGWKSNYTGKINKNE